MSLKPVQPHGRGDVRPSAIIIALLIMGSPCLIAAEVTPGSEPLEAGEALTPVNTIDPLTGLAVDPNILTLIIVIDTEAVDPPHDPRDPGRTAEVGVPRRVCIGFSSSESRETVVMADPATKQKYAKAALANQALHGGVFQQAGS